MILTKRKCVFDILGDRQEARRHASVLVLAELARHASVIVYSYVGTILEHIWGTFREQKVRNYDDMTILGKCNPLQLCRTSIGSNMGQCC
jgi:hypothetical protein